MPYEHWSTEKGYKKDRAISPVFYTLTYEKAGNFCDLSKYKLVCATEHFGEKALLRLIAKTNLVDPGLNVEIFSLQIYGDSVM